MNIKLAARLWSLATVAHSECNYETTPTNNMSDKMRYLAVKTANEALRKYGLDRSQLKTDIECLEQAERIGKMSKFKTPKTDKLFELSSTMTDREAFEACLLSHRRLEIILAKKQDEMVLLKCCGNCALKNLTAIPDVLTHPYRDFCAVCKKNSMWHLNIESAIRTAKGMKK